MTTFNNNIVVGGGVCEIKERDGVKHFRAELKLKAIPAAF